VGRAGLPTAPPTAATPCCQHGYRKPLLLDARHRAHARVEDRIRTGRDTSLGRHPSRSIAANQAWLTTMIAVDQLAFAQTLLLHDTGFARAEPKTLRYRLLHVAARLTPGQRRLWLRIDQNGAPLDAHHGS
jgi:hypothetical protein